MAMANEYATARMLRIEFYLTKTHFLPCTEVPAVFVALLLSMHRPCHRGGSNAPAASHCVLSAYILLYPALP
jgi:hypothetical protein